MNKIRSYIKSACVRHYISKYSIILVFISADAQLFSQAPPGNDYTLKGAVDYALKHNAAFLNTELDVKLSEYRRKEFRAMGFPQASASADVKDFFEIPTNLLPGDFFGMPGTYIPVRFGTQYNATAGVSVSQLIFNSDYFIALQASKHVKNLSEKSMERSKAEIVTSVTKAYYTALISRERLKLLDINISRLKKLYDDLKALNEKGFAEKIDVDRVELSYNNLLTEKEKILRMVGLTSTLLKFQMGMDLKQDINLSDSLNAGMLQDIEISSQAPNYNARPEFAMLESQQNLNQVELRRYRLQHLPSMFAYASYSRQAQRVKFDIFDFSQEWYPIGIIGATLNVPIFNGGMKYFKIQQSKINILKTTNSINNLKLAIELEINSVSVNYRNAYASMQSQTRNKELALRIYTTSKKKYEAGVSSQFELLSAETALREAETNYLNAVYELLVAKTDLDKANGNIK